MKIPSYEYKVPEFFGDSNWHSINYNSPLSLRDPLKVIVGFADLNNQWVLADPSLSTSTNPDASIIAEAGVGYYVVKSNSNLGRDNQIATMYIRFSSNYTGGLVFKIQNRGESNYDYPIITLDDGTNYNISHSLTTSFSDFTVSASGEHILTVVYRKDSSTSSTVDRAYLAIPDTIELL